MPVDTLPPRLTSPDELARALRAPRFLLFKHSTRCPVSAGAFAEYGRFRRAHPDVSTGWIDVIDDRSLSQSAAELTGVAHESPQVLLLQDGRVAWTASHGDVTLRAIETALGMPSGLGGG
jgi:monothiol bacilliredoxin